MVQAGLPCSESFCFWDTAQEAMISRKALGESQRQPKRCNPKKSCSPPKPMKNKYRRNPQKVARSILLSMFHFCGITPLQIFDCEQDLQRPTRLCVRWTRDLHFAPSLMMANGSASSQLMELADGCTKTTCLPKGRSLSHLSREPLSLKAMGTRPFVHP